VGNGRSGDDFSGNGLERLERDEAILPLLSGVDMPIEEDSGHNIYYASAQRSMAGAGT
jgi:hypothetical protein